MTIWFVSRHPGAKEWVKKQGITVDRFVEHLKIPLLETGDKVIGTLPIHLIAQLCAQGIEYWNLNLDLPFEARGKELNADELNQYGAHLERYEAKKLDTVWE